jgi:hypothetical protein
MQHCYVTLFSLVLTLKLLNTPCISYLNDFYIIYLLLEKYLQIFKPLECFIAFKFKYV